MGWLNDPEIAAWFETFLSLVGIAAIIALVVLLLKDRFFDRGRDRY